MLVQTISHLRAQICSSGYMVSSVDGCKTFRLGSHKLHKLLFVVIAINQEC